MSTINRNIRELSKVTHCNFMFFTIRLMAMEEVFASKLQIFDKLLSFLLPILDLSPIVSFFNAPMIVHKSCVVNQKNLTKMWSRINTYYSESQFFWIVKWYLLCYSVWYSGMQTNHQSRFNRDEIYVLLVPELQRKVADFGDSARRKKGLV